MFNIPFACHEKISRIRLLILDVDGVLTDGRLFFDHQGNEYKSFHARDGHGLKLLQQSGVKVAIISGRNSPTVALRMKNLGIEHVYQGYEDKRHAFADLLAKLQLTAEQTAYVGDDILDLPVMRQVGFAVAVQDAHMTIKPYAHWCTSTPGGLGAVREVCDLIMHEQGSFEAMLQTYL